MQPHDKLAKLLSRVEPVEWLYDGLNGKIIPWTKQNGGHSDDPSVQAFVVARDGSVVSRCPDAKAYSASGFAGWLEDEVRAYEAKYPRTVLVFETARVETPDGAAARCAAFDEARAAESGKPLLLFVGRDEKRGDDRKARAEAKATRSFEKAAFNHKDAKEASKGWVLLRFDLGEKAHRAFAKGLGVEKAPKLLLFLPGEQEPKDLGRIKGASLVYYLEKHKPD